MDKFLIGALVLGAMVALPRCLAMIFRPNPLKRVPWFRGGGPLDIGPIPERDGRPRVLIVNHNTSWTSEGMWKDMALEEALSRQGFRVTQIKATPEELADLKRRHSCLGHEFTKIILNGGSVSRVHDILEEFQRELAHAC